MNLKKITSKIEKDGYTIIKKAFSKKKINFILNLVIKEHAKIEFKYKGLPKRDKKDLIVYNLQNKNYEFLRILSNPIIQKVCKYFLNDNFFRLIKKDRPNFILNYYNARSSGNKLDLHIDSYMPYLGKKIFLMQFAIILEDQFSNNGCTILKPKSHLSGKFTNRNDRKLKKIKSQAGDIVIWDSRIWHGTEKNTSNKTRWSLIATFSSWWVKQSMDMTKSLPKKIFNKLSINEKILLGYCSIIPKDERGVIRTKRSVNEISYNINDYYK